MLRREYGTFKLANTEATTDSEYAPRLQQYALGAIAELPPYGMPLVGYGLWRSLADARLRAVGVALLAAYASYVGIFNYLSNLPVSSAFYLQIQQRFWPQAIPPRARDALAASAAWLRHLRPRLRAGQPHAGGVVLDRLVPCPEATLPRFRHRDARRRGHRVFRPTCASRLPPFHASSSSLAHACQQQHRHVRISCVAATLALLLAHAHHTGPLADCAVHTGTLFEDFGASVLRALPDKPGGGAAT